jgi:serine/threonine protein phosphatase PrpC
MADVSSLRVRFLVRFDREEPYSHQSDRGGIDGREFPFGHDARTAEARSVQTPQVPTADVRVDLAARTHVGKVRTNNEDNFHVVQYGRYLRTLLSSTPDGEVPALSQETGYGFAVADGMGGMAAGEVASRLAIALFVEHVLAMPDWIFDSEEPRISEVVDRTAQRFKEVNAAVVENAERKSGLTGMGSTLSLAFSLGNVLVVAHVGDSPVMLHSGGELHRLTNDHTLGERMSLLGVADAGRFHNVLTHAIGMHETGGEPDIRRYRLSDSDRLWLCTDGLTNMVDDATIARELARDVPMNVVCDSLIDLALDGGGKDNVTIALAGYRIPEKRRKDSTSFTIS